jgi:hypothetical protein
MMRLNPDATFDCLFVATRLRIQATSFSTQEIHLFAYLACLLWLYRERAVTDWGYEFVGTELGAPFSREIDLALNELLERGYLRKVHNRLNPTELSKQPLHDLSQLDMNQERVECLQAACSSTAAFSVGMVSSALANEPELSRAKAVPSSRLLLEDAARAQLYMQFEALRIELYKRGNDLRLPAVVWLSALYRSSKNVTGEE